MPNFFPAGPFFPDMMCRTLPTYCERTTTPTGDTHTLLSHFFPDENGKEVLREKPIKRLYNHLKTLTLYTFFPFFPGGGVSLWFYFLACPLAGCFWVTTGKEGKKGQGMNSGILYSEGI
jgi:hypothetical protein